MKRLLIFLFVIVNIFWTEFLQPPVAFAVAPVPPVSVQLGQPFKLHYGDKVLLTAEKLSINFIGVENDSRCPARVECVVAGEATILLALQHGNENVVKMAVSTNPRQLRTPSTPVNSAYQVELVALDPLPEANQTIPVEQYVATLIVTKANGVPTATVPPTATTTPTRLPTPTPTPTIVLTPIRSEAKVLTATLDAPFQLSVGQTGVLADEAFKVTLRSASSDSGCFTEDDCSSMQFNGTLALQKDEQKSLMDIMASFDADGAFTTDFAGYTVAMTSVKKLQDDSIIAVFVVSNTAARREAEHPAPAPEFADRCPGFSKFDATALLQEAVQKQAVTNLLFGPLVAEASDLPGLCGYVSTAYTANAGSDVNLPHLATGVKADRAVVAAKLTGDNQLALLQLVNLLQAANPDHQSSDDPVLLKTLLAVGDQEGLFSHLQEMAQGSETLQVTPLEDVGEKALWFWQTYAGGHFAALVAYDGHAFSLLLALLGADIDEADAQTMATTILQKNAPTPTPTAETPTETPTPAATRSCDKMTKTDAAAILGEAVNDEPAAGDEVCGYDSVARKPATSDDPQGEPRYFAVAGTFVRNQAVDYLQSFAEGLHKENPDGDNMSYATIKGLLLDGMIEETFPLFPDLAKGSQTVQVQPLKAIGKNALWLWGKVDGEWFATLVVLAPNNEVSAVFARVNPQRGQNNVQAKMLVVARKLLARSGDDKQVKPSGTPETTRTPVATVITDAAACKGLAQADAEAILGETLTVAPDQAGNLCGYGGIAQKLAGTDSLLALSTHGVAAGILPEAAISPFLLRLAEAIHQDSAKGNENAYNKLKTELSAGMTADALTGLEQLVRTTPKWEIGNLTDQGGFGVWLVRTLENGDHLVFFFAPREDTATILVVAQVQADQEPQTISKAVLSVVEALAE